MEFIASRCFFEFKHGFHSGWRSGNGSKKLSGTRTLYPIPGQLSILNGVQTLQCSLTNFSVFVMKPSMMSNVSCLHRTDLEKLCIPGILIGSKGEIRIMAGGPIPSQ